jgi:hypothetical protein
MPICSRSETRNRAFGAIGNGSKTRNVCLQTSKLS